MDDEGRWKDEREPETESVAARELRHRRDCTRARHEEASTSPALAILGRLTPADWWLLVAVGLAQVAAAAALHAMPLPALRTRASRLPSARAVPRPRIRRAHHLGDRGDWATARSLEHLPDSSACRRTAARPENGHHLPHDRSQADARTRSKRTPGSRATVACSSARRPTSTFRSSIGRARLRDVRERSISLRAADARSLQ